MYVERHLSDTLAKAMQGFPAVLVTGPRQSGKTTFLRHEIGDRADYVTFDDPLERAFAQSDPEGFLNRFTKRSVIVDEIQYVPGLMSFLKMRIDNAPAETGRWLLTGSQQFELMHNLSESLAGRVAILDLYPFSALELMPETLATAVWTGGYPIPALNPERRDLWARSYIRTYLERDVRQIKNIIDLRSFELFIGLCAAYHGQELSKAALARECGLSQPTIGSWIGVMEASFIIGLLPPYFRNYGKRLIKSPKLYFLDGAIVTTLTRQPDAAAAFAGPMSGALVEGWVVTEAIKTFAIAGRKPDLFFWRSHDGLEVDLIIQLGQRLHAVEIKRTATPTVRHCEPLNRFKAIAGTDADDEGLLVCNIDDERVLPGGNRAIPWHRFPQWLAKRISG